MFAKSRAKGGGLWCVFGINFHFSPFFFSFQRSQPYTTLCLSIPQHHHQTSLPPSSIIISIIINMGVLDYLCCGKSRDSFFDSSSGTVGSSEDDIPPQPVELHDVPVKGTTAMPPHRIAPIPRPTIRLLTSNSPSASTHSGVNTSRDVHRQSVISEVTITPAAIDYSTRALQLQYSQ